MNVKLMTTSELKYARTQVGRELLTSCVMTEERQTQLHQQLRDIADELKRRTK